MIPIFRLLKKFVLAYAQGIGYDIGESGNMGRLRECPRCGKEATRFRSTWDIVCDGCGNSWNFSREGNWVMVRQVERGTGAFEVLYAFWVFTWDTGEG